jgi:hypothetical protein
MSFCIVILLSVIMFKVILPNDFLLSVMMLIVLLLRLSMHCDIWDSAIIIRRERDCHLRENKRGGKLDRMRQNEIEGSEYWAWKYCWLLLMNGKQDSSKVFPSNLNGSYRSTVLSHLYHKILLVLIKTCILAWTGTVFFFYWTGQDWLGTVFSKTPFHSFERDWISQKLNFALAWLL